MYIYIHIYIYIYIYCVYIYIYTVYIYIYLFIYLYTGWDMKSKTPRLFINFTVVATMTITFLEIIAQPILRRLKKMNKIAQETMKLSLVLLRYRTK